MSSPLTSLIACLTLIASASGQQQASPALPVPALAPYFYTGYEPAHTLASPTAAIETLIFQESTRQLAGLPWAMGIYYESPGTPSDRFARLAPDPTGAANEVLHMQIQNAVIDAGYQGHTKGRVQSGFFGKLVDAEQLYSKQRLFLHKDMQHLESYPLQGDPWWIGVVLDEIWVGAAWDNDPFPARIGLSLVPLVGATSGKLLFELSCRSGVNQTVFWDQVNPSFEVPTGEWLTIEMGYKMGDATSGRAALVVTRESTGVRTVVFDITGWTYDPANLGAGGPGPVPATHWNPQKLYTSDNVINHIKAQGGAAQLFWDDFEFAGHWPKHFP